MTPREQAAFNAGVETARQMALITAVTIKTRDGSEIVRDQAAVAALQGFADGLRVAFLDPPPEANPMRSVFAAISADDSDSGSVECPVCKGRLTWPGTASTAICTASARRRDASGGCSRWEPLSSEHLKPGIAQMRDSGIHVTESGAHLGTYTMSPTSNVNDLARRLRKLEGETRSPRHLPVRVYAMEGPKNLPPGAAEAFLRGCGHAFDADHHNIIRIMVAADRDLPMKDLTDRYGREPRVPASGLHVQHGRG